MKRIGYTRLALLAAFAITVLPVAVATATPAINSAVLIPRHFNDCAVSLLSSVDNYPAHIEYQDVWPGCFGSNLHLWRLSTDDATAAQFANGDAFRFSAVVTILGDGKCEAGLQIAPWWSMTDGRFNVRVPDGEIACFGGRLPFYSFTAAHSISYVRGEPIQLEIIYLANGLTLGSPATIEYKVVYQGNPYTSGPLPFDEGNPAEGHGSWGILTPAEVGGYMQTLGWNGENVNRTLHAMWDAHQFEILSNPTAAGSGTWGRLKTLYR